MNIAIIGASGFIGSALREEALSRGHRVTALVSRPERLATQPGLTVIKADVQDTDALTEQLKGFDAVLSAFSGHAQTDVGGYFATGFDSILAAATSADVKRLMVVGGAGSLEVAPGVQLIDTPAFPAEYKATAEGARYALNQLRAQQNVNWTMLSPAAMIAPGERTGQYKLGTDQLVTDASGNSQISVEDYAKAMIDELESPAHLNRRFTLAYA
ncbi:NAD(P)-dependent oxidoreductase [Photobacterium galatheae]|uniref:3-beta hydroxysteroid dehydrogenase n=1 Tax=Photobacterium galatheae TaxID=1654360 RepID=A0A066RWS0_9GAMM|nr:NAD(P)-dependent oxidoreductase [Photobacterium galatheae]KDM93551.1 3-beta hydroxysteroid dehydrogenase [Photobacterium galatheae]MCM0151375.1 NAD(P)-dependent oxidoreductase [Photobacterium galatheae]